MLLIFEVSESSRSIMNHQFSSPSCSFGRRSAPWVLGAIAVTTAACSDDSGGPGPGPGPTTSASMSTSAPSSSTTTTTSSTTATGVSPTTTTTAPTSTSTSTEPTSTTTTTTTTTTPTSTELTSSGTSDAPTEVPTTDVPTLADEDGGIDASPGDTATTDEPVTDVDASVSEPTSDVESSTSTTDAGASAVTSEQTSSGTLGPNLLTNPDFENGNTNGWRGWGAATITATSAYAYNGTYSARAAGRTETWHGIGTQDLRTILTPGVTYQVQAAVRVALPNDPPTAISHSVQLSVKTACQGEADAYTQHASATVTNSEWTILLGSFTVSTCANLTELTLYAELPPSGVDILIDDVSVREML